MRDPILDPELLMSIMRRRNNGMVHDDSRHPQHRDIPVIQREEEDVKEDETADNNIMPSLKHSLTAIPTILLLGAGLISLMIILAVIQITLLPPILIHDWWLRRRRVLRKVSPEVHVPHTDHD
jgi:hypothetical protein